MATNRKQFHVYLTEEQYKAFKDFAVERGAQSASSFAAEILIAACNLPGAAPERGTYTRSGAALMDQIVEIAFNNGVAVGKVVKNED